MPTDVKRTWDACGAAFDRFTSAEDSYSYNIERPAIEALAGDVKDARVLDLGCGSGTFAVWLAEQGATVVGLDLSPVMISLAGENARRRGVQIDLRVGDINRRLTFADAEFDLVFSATALHYVEDLEGLMREAARVMKPGARFIASVLHPMSTAWFALPDSCDDSEAEQSESRPRYFGAPCRVVETPWLDFGDVPSEGRRIACRHHTLSDYFRALARAGLTLTDLREPSPPPEFAMRNARRYEEATHLPLFLIFKAEAIN
ncbi:MAG TPA: class I SAM-dependent methyltransferase [Blastocatellia bacterium]|nr:class I SAM-dependent methyltransferase [Blastocatellia bacterium]